MRCAVTAFGQFQGLDGKMSYPIDRRTPMFSLRSLRPLRFRVFDCRRDSSSRLCPTQKLVSRLLQTVQRHSSEFFLDQNVIRVIRRDREDRNAIRRQRLNERKQDAGLRERKRPLELQANPVMLCINFSRQKVSQANNRKLVRGACDRCELTLRGPFGNESIRRKPHDSISPTQPAKFEFLTFSHQIPSSGCPIFVAFFATGWGI